MIYNTQSNIIEYSISHILLCVEIEHEAFGPRYRLFTHTHKFPIKIKHFQVSSSNVIIAIYNGR